MSEHRHEAPSPPQCDMRHDCVAPVRRIDRKGWLYCDTHGKQRLAAGLGGRLLTASERDALAAGKPLKSYGRHV